MRPRLLTVTPDFPPSLGGVQVLLERLLERLPGFEHLVVARAAAGPPSAIPSRRTRLSEGQPAIVELTARAVATGLRFRPDAIIAGHVTAGPAAAALRRLTGAPVVLVGHADELTHRPRLTALSIRAAAQVVVVSRYTASLVDAPSLVIPPGFDPPVVAGARDARPTIITVARLADRYKGHDVVLDALPAVLEAVPGARWLVAGDGPLRPELEARAQALGLIDAVTFLGRVTDAERDRLLGQAWCFVMPSRLPERGAGGEGFGIVYLEAAAAGLPVVAGAVAGALDAVDDGRTGLLVDPTSPAAIAEALIAVLGDRDRAAAMGDAGRAWAAGFSWDRMAAAYEDVLTGVLR